ncbi:MAG: hypothetical protein F4071_05300, partial [Acidimicrobiaceae bacterium]|nr:hypothetical protein [Acidimicrobiaceae bacterium]
DYHNCAITTDGKIACWGRTGFWIDDAPEGSYESIATGTYHTCAVTSDDSIVCGGSKEPPEGLHWEAQ